MSRTSSKRRLENEGQFDPPLSFEVLQQIGKGGCGVVFMAEQEELVRREVALRIVKPGIDTKDNRSCSVRGNEKFDRRSNSR